MSSKEKKKKAHLMWVNISKTGASLFLSIEVIWMSTCTWRFKLEQKNLVQVITFQILFILCMVEYIEHKIFHSHIHIYSIRSSFFSSVVCWTDKNEYMNTQIWCLFIDENIAHYIEAMPSTSRWSFVLVLIKYLNWNALQKKKITSEYDKNYYEIVRIIRTKEQKQKK